MVAMPTSVEKALEICEVLSRHPRGLSLAELGRTAGMPAPTAHRLLAVLKRQGYVRKDEETQRYGLTLKMLDLSFQLLGRSELRLHAYPVLREHALRSGMRSFVAVPGTDEVTYIWSSSAEDIAMRTAYGRPMPAHCKLYFSAPQATRRLSCLRQETQRPGDLNEPAVLRLGPPDRAAGNPRLCCTCAPVQDHTGREVARVGVFAHDAEEAALVTSASRECRELARQVSRRLGYLPTATLDAPA